MAIRFIRTPTGIIRYDNNFTDEQKRKLLNIEWGAQVNTVLGVKGSNESKWRIGYIEINKDNVGLGRVDNTPDVEKNVFSATRLTTGRDITIGNKTVNFNGTVNIGYTLREIGAVNRAGDTMTGKLTGTVIEAPSLIGELTGNSSSATKLQTGRDITIGDKTVNFDGTKNIGYTIREIGATRRDGDTIIGTYTFDMTTMDKSINIASIPVNKYGIHLGSILGTGLYLVANSSGKGIIINTNGESIGLDITVSSDDSYGIKISNETDAYSIHSVGKNYLGVLTAKSLSVTDGIHATDLASPINFTIGNKTISFNGASAMNYTLKDIGAVNRAGDTMTGKLTGTVIEAPSLIGELTGNSSSATKLQTGRDITIGNRTVNFDGTSNISYTLAQIGAVNKAGDTMTGALTGTTITANSFVGPLTGNAATATKLAAGRDITIGNRTVNFDGSANISYTLAQIGAVNRAGDTMTGKLTGTVIEAPSLIGELTGNAATATKFKKAMKLTIGNKTYDLDGSTDLVYTFNDVGYLTSDTKYAASDTVGGAAKNLNYFLTTATTSLGLEQSVNAIGYVNNVSILGQNDGALIVQRYSDSWKAEIFMDYRTGQMATRGKNNGTWQSWRTQLDSGNYGSYAVPLTGGTMSGNLSIVNTSPVLTIKNSNGGDTSLIFDRNSNANWKILSSSGTLHFQTDFTSSKQSSYHNVMTLEYNTGYVHASRFVGAVTGEVTGNASTATKLQTARTIALSGSVTGSASFDGSGNITISTTTNHDHNILLAKGTNTISSTSNDTTSNWGAHNNSVHWYTTAGYLNNQPSQWGYLINIGFNAEVHQLWLEQSNGSIFHRGGNSSGWNGTWKKMLDSTNYTSYTVTKTGGGATGTWEISISGDAITWNGYKQDIGTLNTTDTWLLVAKEGKIQHKLSTDFASAGHTHNYLPLSGGTMSGNLSIVNTSPVLTIKNSNNTDVSLVFDRNANANWKILSSGGILHFQTDFTSSKQSSYHDVMTLDFSNNSVNASKFVGPITGEVTGNASTATKLQTARAITLSGAVTGSVSFDGSANVTLSTSVNHTHSYLPLAGGTMTGNIEFSNSGTTSRGVIGTVGDNDYWRIIGGATASNAGFLEISTADDGNEPIYVRQYSSGKFVTLKRTLTLLDGNGNSSFPGTVTAPTFSGSLSGNATSATYVKLTTSGGLSNLAFSNASYSGSVTSVNIPYYKSSTLMELISTNYINAGTATKLQTARTIALSGAVTGSVSFDGSANVTLSTSVNHTHSYLPLAGGTMTGDIIFGNMTTTSDTTRGIKGTISDNDTWGIVAHSVGIDYSYLEIYTGDNASEGIIVRQYGQSSNRTAYLLTAQGNTTFPGTVTAPTFSGSLSGKATSAGQLSDSYNSVTKSVTLNVALGGLIPSESSNISIGNPSYTFNNAYIAGIVLNGNSNLGIAYGTKIMSDTSYSHTGMKVGDIRETGNSSYTIISQDCIISHSCKIYGLLYSVNHIPQANNTYNLGSSGTKWSNIYATNGTIQTSDERLKNIKGLITDDYKELITSITPMMYTFKNQDGEKEHDRIHMGFSAQQVKRIMDKIGITDKEFAGYCRDDVYPTKEVIDSDGKTQHIADKTKDPVDYRLSLRYGEFIPIITAVLQDVIKENKELRQEINQLKQKIN